MTEQTGPVLGFAVFAFDAKGACVGEEDMRGRTRDDAVAVARDVLATARDAVSVEVWTVIDDDKNPRGQIADLAFYAESI